MTDNDVSNNSYTLYNAIQLWADLYITKTNDASSVTTGSPVSYTISAFNPGPSNVTGVTVADTLPASLTGASWSCVGAGGGTCAAAGSGNLNEVVNLPAGSSVTYTVTATLSPSASGSLSNTATITAPAGVSDPNPGNNSATDTDAIAFGADLTLGISDGLSLSSASAAMDKAFTLVNGVTTVTAGSTVTYFITASNAGPSSVTGATVSDTLPAALSGASWTCVGSGGGSCAASGTGNINELINLPAGGSVTFTLTATVSFTATGTLSNTASISAPPGVSDVSLVNNSATHTALILPAAAGGATGVPTLGQWALMALALLLALGGSVGVRRR